MTSVTEEDTPDWGEHEGIVKAFSEIPLPSRAELPENYPDIYILQMISSRVRRLMRLRDLDSPKIILDAEKYLILKAIRLLMDEPKSEDSHAIS